MKNDVLTPDAPITNTPLTHSDVFINHLLDQVSFLREQIKSKDQQMNFFLEQSSRRDHIYLSKCSVLPENIKQTNIEQKSDQEPIPSTIPMPTPKKNLSNSDVVNVDNNETFPISNGTSSKEKDSHIESVPKKELPKNTQSNNSNHKKINHPANEKFIGNSKSVVILGDSMIKHLNGWEMSKKVNNPGCKIYVKYFVGAKNNLYERLYAALSKKYPKSLHPSCWHHSIYYNDLDSNKTAESIANTIIL